MEVGDVEARGAEGREVDVVGRHARLVARTALISFLTLLSRIAGFVRETKTAALFGDASGVSDAFITAWRIPNLFRALMGEGAIVTALQTELTRVDHERGEAAGRAFFHSMLRLVTRLCAVVCVLAMLVAWFLPDRMPITGWGWLGEHPAAVREFTVRMLPFVVLVCLSAVVGGALNVRGHFLAPSIAPVVMNLGWIAALVAVGWAFGAGPAGAGPSEHDEQMGMARWLATYVLVAGVILLVVQLPALRGAGLAGASSSEERALSRRAAWSALRAGLPLALGAAAYQVHALVGGVLAIALLPQGGSSLLYYVTRLQQLPLSLVAIAATSAVFPMLTALGERRELDRVRQLHDRTHLAVAYVAVPASLGLAFFAEPILAACFQHGEFAAAGVERAAWGLRALALAILPAGAAGLVARTYYALGRPQTPVWIAFALVFVNVGLSVGAVAGLGLDLEGLAWSTTICAWLNLLLLLPGLRGRLALPPSQERVLPRLGRIGLAAGLSTGLAWATWVAWLGTSGSPVALMLCILLSVGLYGAFSQLLAIEEWRELLSRVRKRIAG
ncbi:MAG: murein biosynthesis integral membrane protein MurJ [Planctomycetes bacterium]|nr:murein biosynthesis integral membrane protein MurJ [Planctomycetota bacterium]